MFDFRDQDEAQTKEIWQVGGLPDAVEVLNRARQLLIAGQTVPLMGVASSRWRLSSSSKHVWRPRKSFVAVTVVLSSGTQSSKSVKRYGVGAGIRSGSTGSVLIHR